MSDCELFFEVNPTQPNLADIMACPRCGELLRKCLCRCHSMEEILAVIVERYRAGESKTTLEEALEQRRHMAMVTEEEDDAILDVMDFVAGWCAPHMRLEDLVKSVETLWR